MNNKYMIFRRVIYPFRHLRTFSSAKRILSNKKYLPSEEWLLKRMDSRKGWILEMGISQKAMEQFNELIYLEYQFDVVESGRVVNQEALQTELFSIETTREYFQPQEGNRGGFHSQAHGAMSAHERVHLGRLVRCFHFFAFLKKHCPVGMKKFRKLQLKV